MPKKRTPEWQKAAEKKLAAVAKLAEVCILAGIWGYLHFVALISANVSVQKNDVGWWLGLCGLPIAAIDVWLIRRAYRHLTDRRDSKDEWPAKEYYPDFKSPKQKPPSWTSDER